MDYILFKQIRLTLDLNQSQFGKLLGVSRTYVSMMETNRRIIPGDIAKTVKQKVDSDLIIQIEELLNAKLSLSGQK